MIIMPLVKYKRKDMLRILKAFLKYIDTNDLPIVAEFAYQNEMPESTLRSFQLRHENVMIKHNSVYYDFSCALKKSADKQRVYFIRQLDQKGINPASYIFLLKALHQFSDQGDKKADETHIHIHQQSADKVKKMSDAELTKSIQSELLKPAEKRRSSRN